uniref:Neurochondrin n=1 Tax=Scleropages formosus TaxID=113540 RepID=A0A8C9S8X7_SCLFO
MAGTGGSTDGGTTSLPGSEEDAADGGAERRGLSADKQELLERCLDMLTQAQNDSQTLAALLVITRLCPANQLDRATLQRLFDAVGLALPARLLMTAMQTSAGSALSPEDMLSLGSSLLSALSSVPAMAAHPQLLRTVPLLLTLLSEGLEGDSAECAQLDEVVAIDCYSVLSAVCASAQGPEKLLARGAVPALCRAAARKLPQSRQMGVPLLGHLLSSRVGPAAWSRHPAELSSLLTGLATDFCQASDHSRLDMCALMAQFLPPCDGVPESAERELQEVGSRLWGALRPLVQAKIAPAQLGEVLVLSACVLDLFGWEPVRMALEEPPGTELLPRQRNTVTACYRIMEAAMEQACRPEPEPNSAQQRAALTGLSLQQSRQVLGALEEAFSAVIYYLQQVDISRHGDPFVFASFRALCAWLAEETSCLRKEVTALLPTLVSYVRGLLEAQEPGGGLIRWMSNMSVSSFAVRCPNVLPLLPRYLLPALCHLTAEEEPRRVLLTLETHALLVEFLGRSWHYMKAQGGKVGSRDSSMETACSALLNLAVTETALIREEPCFRALQSLLSDMLPSLLHKPRLLVLAANVCTLGLMIGRTIPVSTGVCSPVDPVLRRFFSTALRFLSGALSGPDAGGGPARVSPAWEEWWDETHQLWALGYQALAACAGVQPWVVALARDGGWLAETLALLSSCSALPRSHSQEVLEEVLMALAHHCPLCRGDIAACVSDCSGGPLRSMARLQGCLAE